MDLSDLKPIPALPPVTSRTQRITPDPAWNQEPCYWCGIEFAPEDLTKIDKHLYGPCCLAEAREREAQRRDEYLTEERWERWARR